MNSSASSSQLRRLAPQRKKVPAAAASAGSILQADAPDAATTTTTAPSTAAAAGDVLPSDTLRGEDDYDRYDFASEEDGSDDDDDDEDSPMITNNVADWTTRHFNINSNSTSSKQQLMDVFDLKEDEGVDSDDAFEIESSTSRSLSNNDNDDDDENNNDEDDVGDIFQIITEEQVSLSTPPPTSPYVMVNLETLCGCKVENMTEKLVLLQQLMETLLGSSSKQEQERRGDDIEDTTDTKPDLGDGLSLDFDERVIDLFESGVASHVDSSYPIAISCISEENESVVQTNGMMEGTRSEENVVTPYALVPYPEFLTEQSTNTSTIPSTKSRSTLRLWKLLHTVPTQHPQISPLLTRIFAHLRNTSRSLLWKASMHYEISLLAKEEFILHMKRMQLQEYNDWKTNVRGERLQKLYDVRETFLLQVEVARKKHDALVEEREGRVERELRRRGLLSELNNSMALHNSSEILLGSQQDGKSNDVVNSFEVEPCYGDDDDDGWGGTVIHEDEIIGGEMGIVQHQMNAVTLGEVVDEDENDEWSPLNVTVNPLGMNVTVDGLVANDDTENIIDSKEDNTSSAVEGTSSIPDTPIRSTSKLEPISHDDNIQRKSHRLQKRKEVQHPPSTSTSTKQRHEYLKREQHSIRESLKTTEERIAEATLLKLEERLQNVDDLLERLQEEEWADEEEGNNDDEIKQSGVTHVDANRDDDKESSRLLDNVLAMILGALPKEMSSVGDTAITDDIHYKHIKEEHDSIVQEWIRVFGRLPPCPSPEVEPEPEKENEDRILAEAENEWENFLDMFEHR